MTQTSQHFMKIVFSLSLLFFTHVGWGQANDPQRVPGTKVSLAPPKDFVPASNFGGFVHPEGASIMVTEMNGSVSEGAKALTGPLLTVV